MKKRTRLIAGVMAMMLTLGGCGSAANTANKKEALRRLLSRLRLHRRIQQKLQQKKQNWMF